MLKNKAAGFNFQTFCAFWLCKEGEGGTGNQVCLAFLDKSKSDGQKLKVPD